MPRLRAKARWLLVVVIVVLAAALVFFAVTRTDRTISPLASDAQATLHAFQSLPGVSTVNISPDEEPGERLLLCLRFVDKSTRSVLANREVYIYHASAAGEYEPSDPSDDLTARLHGTGVTDSDGKLFLDTTLPGDYGSSADNRHIHLEVPGAHPEAYDIHFSQYSTFMLRRFIAGSDQHFLANLKRTHDGKLVCFVSVEVKMPADSA